MDTIEELNGTYFYRALSGLSSAELFNLIFLEGFADRFGLEITAAALILSGQPLLPTRAKPIGAKKGTSIASVLSRKLLKDVRLPRGLLIPTIVGGNIRHTNKIEAALGRAVPWIGHSMAIVAVYQIASATRNKYNLIARQKDRIQWTYF